MTEEKIEVTEKSKEKYFYVDKEKTYSVLTQIATAFIGAGLALIVFGALHKPPMPPCHQCFKKPMPCPMQMIDRKGPRGVYNHRGDNFRRHQDFRGKNFKKDRYPAAVKQESKLGNKNLGPNRIPNIQDRKIPSQINKTVVSPKNPENK